MQTHQKKYNDFFPSKKCLLVNNILYRLRSTEQLYLSSFLFEGGGACMVSSRFLGVDSLLVQWCIITQCETLCLVTQLCLTLCDLMNCSPPGSSVHGDSPGKNTRVGYHALLQGIFPTQGSKPGLLHCRQVLDQQSHRGSPTSMLPRDYATNV